MRRPTVVALSALVVAVLALAGVAVVQGNDDGHGPGMMTTAVDRDPGPRGRDGFPRGTPGWMAGGMMNGGMHGLMGGPMNGMAGMHVVRSEQEFLVEMVAHHEEAIEAAGELARSERAEMRELGRSIVEGQTAEVEQMREWLARWYPDAPTDADYEPMMRDLSGLSGDRLDQVFLEDMVWHHMAAVMMSRQLVARDLAEHDEVEELAGTIAAAQHAEILMMRRWLWEWFG
ncbi:DUF305 domain-containing protein [Nocardioides sediminis]|uniref:DUF305 domain-containing protein n=1 Tax=Nocardioides sediminis TaxID=433648 RepID=UPI000D300AB2|nr:DUF305 domain-containing protein [Nocardioides sediminis]